MVQLGRATLRPLFHAHAMPRATFIPAAPPQRFLFGQRRHGAIQRSSKSRLSMTFGPPPGNRGPGLSTGTILNLTFLALLLFAPGLLFGAINLFFVVFTLGPILAIAAFSLWAKASQIEGVCPVCSAPLQGVKGSNMLCFNCGNVIEVTPAGTFASTTPVNVRDDRGRQATFKNDGVIDVDAIDD